MAFAKLNSSNTQISQLFSGQSRFHDFTSLCSQSLRGFILIIPYHADLQGFFSGCFLYMNRTFCHLQQWWHARNRTPILPHNTASGFTKTFHRGQKRSLSCHIDLTYFSFPLNSTYPWFLTHLIIFLPSWNQLLLSQHLTFLYSSSTTTPHGSSLTLLISTFPLPPFYLHLLTSISYIASVASLWCPLPILLSNQFILPTATRVIF